MAREGQNPMKWLQPTSQPRRITVTTIVHIPGLRDFWAESLDVLKLCFQSLHDNTGQPFDLMVVDNGSCREVREYLLESQSAGRIQFLTFSSYNLRKLGALKILLSAAPGEIISYADSDVYFLPGWLDASLKVLEVFPEAGQVTALPTSDRIGQFTASTLKGIERDQSLKVRRGYDLVPACFKEVHRLSIGKSKQQYAQTLQGKEEVLIVRNGVSAFASAQDFQFTTTRRVLESIGPLVLKDRSEYFDPLYSPAFEARADEKGFWRLSTTDYLVHHVGNRMPASTEGSAWIFQESARQSSLPNASQPRPGIKSRVLRSTKVRRILKRINTVSYSLLFEK
jgi:glycosyltransferase involved in cell wall biosynthesis